MKRVDECNSLACSHYCKQTPKQYQYPQEKIQSLLQVITTSLSVPTPKDSSSKVMAQTTVSPTSNRNVSVHTCQFRTVFSSGLCNKKFKYNIFKGPFHVPPKIRLVFVHTHLYKIQTCRLCGFVALLCFTMFKYVNKTTPRHPTQLFKTFQARHASSLQWTNQRLQLTLLG